MPTLRNPDQVRSDAPPPPIAVSATLRDLEADPAALQDAAAGLRERALRLVSAQTTVDESAARLTADRDWVGDSADAYQSHRVTLTRDLGGLAELLGEVADTLDEIAWILADGQGRLDEQWATIASIPHSGSGRDVRFRPANADEAALVHAAVTAAEEIRSSVDEGLVLRESALVSTGRDLATIKDAWEPRTLTVMNLNVGQGKGNEPWFWPGGDRAEEGTDPDDMDEIADIIADQGADVVTLEEVFGKDINDDLMEPDNLETLLEERTGDDWEIHFTEADGKHQVDDGIIPDAYVAPFGNAVAVREGDLIADSDPVVGEHKLDTDGGTVRVTGEYPARDALPDEVDDGEARVAAVVEVEIREDD